MRVVSLFESLVSGKTEKQKNGKNFIVYLSGRKVNEKNNIEINKVMLNFIQCKTGQILTRDCFSQGYTIKQLTLFEETSP